VTRRWPSAGRSSRSASRLAPTCWTALKTRAELVERLTARVTELHSYDCPCVVALPIVAGNADYLDWIACETARVGA
jgi:hypothetical protein